MAFSSDGPIPMTSESPRDTMRTFAVLVAGQFISFFGSELTSFGLVVWLFKQTDSVTEYALVAMASSLTPMLLAPVVGALVDGWNRRHLMVGASLLGLFTNGALLVLLALGKLSLWHIFLAMAFAAAVKAIQLPVLLATMPLLVPERQLGRASGFLQLGNGVAQVVSPALAGVLMEFIELRGIILVDCATFVLALLILLASRLPRYVHATKPVRVQGSRWREMAAGWACFTQQPILFGLLGFHCLVNFLDALLVVLVPPLILKVASAAALGTVTSVASAGMMGGSLLLMVWGGPRRRLGGISLVGVLFGAGFILTGSSHSLTLWALGGFCILFCLALLTSLEQAFWAARVAPEYQGRVQAVRLTLEWASMSLSYLVAGPLADGFLEPLLKGDGSWARHFKTLVGTGPERGIALLFVLTGALCVLWALALYLPRVMRRLDEPHAPYAPQEVQDPQPHPSV